MTNAKNTPWTPELDARLLEMWNAGITAKQIGLNLGMTKNSIVSRSKRIPGIIPRPSPITTVRARPPKPPPAPRIKKIALVPKKPTPPPRPPEDGVVGVGGRHGVCQWVVGDACGAQTLYCGRPSKTGRAWCEGHAVIVFQAPKKPVDKKGAAP